MWKRGGLAAAEMRDGGWCAAYAVWSVAWVPMQGVSGFAVVRVLGLEGSAFTIPSAICSYFKMPVTQAQAHDNEWACKPVPSSLLLHCFAILPTLCFMVLVGDMPGMQANTY